MKRKNKLLLFSFAVLFLIGVNLFLKMTMLNESYKNQLSEMQQELATAEKTIDEYSYHLWMLNVQRGKAMKAYEDLR